MSTTHCTALAHMCEEDRNVAVDCLAASLFTESAELGYAEAFTRAEALLPELAAFELGWDAETEAERVELEQLAADWDAAASDAQAAQMTPPPAHNELLAGDAIDLEEGIEAPVTVGEPVYLPALLDPHEQRAVDKALYQRAAGIVPQLVGRFWFVPSRTTGGVVYRVTPDSCTCEAFQRGGRLCWHRCLIGIERELAA